MTTGLSRNELEKAFNKHFEEHTRKLKAANDGGGATAQKISKLSSDAQYGLLLGFAVAAILDTISQNNDAISII